MASYSSQDRSSVAKFTPLSMQEILYPAQMLAQQHIEAEKEYQAEQDKAALLKTMLVEGVDKEAISELNRYSGTVSSAINELSDKGVVGGATRRNLLNIKKDYNEKLMPLQSVALKREQAAKTLAEKKLNDNTFEYVDPYKKSLTKGLADPSIYMQSGISGSELMKQVAQQASVVAKKTTMTPELIKAAGINYQYFVKYGQGATLEQIQKAALDNGDKTTFDNITNYLSGIVDTTMQASGAAEMFGVNSNEYKRLKQNARLGLAAAVGEDKWGNMADQYGMSSALASQKFEQDKELLKSKLEYDKELLRYKKSLETPDPQPLDIFNYSQAEPQKRVAAEKPEGFDNLFTPDGKIRSELPKGIRMPIPTAGGIQMTSSGGKNKHEKSMRSIVDKMKSTYGNVKGTTSRGIEGVPIKNMTDKDILNIYYNSASSGGFASAQISQRDDYSAFGNSDKYWDLASMTSDKKPIYIDGKPLKNATPSVYLRKIGMTAKEYGTLISESKQPWDITSVKGKPMFTKVINGHVIHKAMDKSEEAVWSTMAEAMEYDQTAGLFSEPKQIQTNYGVTFQLSKGLNGLEILVKNNKTGAVEEISPADILDLTTKFAVKNGFITPTGQRKDTK
jgi:hypothetical protein